MNESHALTESAPSPWYGVRLAIPALLSLVLLLVDLSNHLLFHTLAELFSVVIAVLAMTVAWHTYRFARNNFFMYLSSGYFWIGVLDLFHTLTYKGVDVLNASDGRQETLQFWISARFLQALLLLSAPLFLTLRYQRHVATLMQGAAVAVALTLIFSGHFPAMYLPGTGLTHVKVYSEYAIIALFAAALVFVWHRSALLDQEVVKLVALAIIATGVSEFCLTLYSHFGEAPTVIGHLLKLWAFWFIYEAVVHTTLAEPFRALAHGATTYEAVPDATVLVDRDGIIRQANRAARRFAGLDEDLLIGGDVHDLFHPTALLRESCPLCRHIRNGEAIESLECYFSGREVWHQVSLSPITTATGSHGMIHVNRDVTPRKRVEQALAENHERLSYILNSAAEGIYGLDHEGRATFVNPAFEAITGWQAAEVIGRDMHSLLHHSHADGSAYPVGECPIYRTMRLGDPCRVQEDSFWRRDGSSFPVAYSAAVITDRHGEAAGCVVVFHDISLQRQAEQALRQSEQKYRTLLENLPQGIFLKDCDSVYLSCNGHYARDLGILPDDICGRTDFDFFPVELAEKYRADDRRVIAGGKTVSLEESYIVGEQTCLVQTIKTPVRDESGAITGVLGMFLDITERKRAEEALLASEIQLAEAEQIARLGSWKWDLVEGTMLISRQFYHILGRSPDEFAPSFESLIALVDPSAQQMVEDRFRRILAKGELLELEVPMRHADGSVRYFQVHGKVRRDDEGNAKSLLGTALDITERKRSEEDLRRYRDNLELLVTARTEDLRAANRELESFSYSVSHDLRSPLRAINGFSRALIEDCGSQLDETGRRYLDRIANASNHMSKLIDGLLTLSRVQRRELELESLDLTRIAREIAHRFQESEPERNVQFVLEEGLSATGDSTLVRLLLENLIGNAWKFTGRQPAGVIEFNRTSQQNEETFYVKDNGVGFDMRYVDKLFQPFQRLHTVEEFAGTGIGLATVRRIIRRHGGRVWAEGEPGRFAAIYFTLPSRQSEVDREYE